MLRQHKGSLLRAERQGEATMKQQKAILIAAIIFKSLCITDSNIHNGMTIMAPSITV